MNLKLKTQIQKIKEINKRKRQLEKRANKKLEKLGYYPIYLYK